MRSGLVVMLMFLAAGAAAADGFQERFEAVAARSGEVMNLTPAELQALLGECEALKTQLETLPESPRKVYRKRLELSCNLVRFALEQKSSPAQ